MERIESFDDYARGVVTYRLANGRYVTLDARYVAELGAGECLRREGLGDLVPTGRVPVYQSGQEVGSLPADLDVSCPRSRSPLYQPRSGDLRREGDRVVASRMLGPGDLEAIVGFSYERAPPRQRRDVDFREARPRGESLSMGPVPESFDITKINDVADVVVVGPIKRTPYR